MAHLLTSSAICFVLELFDRKLKKEKNEFENLVLRIAKLIFCFISCVGEAGRHFRIL
jgi:hypothetical protein